MDEKQIADKILRAYKRAVKRITGRAKTKLRYWSSGSFSYHTLRSVFDHPYATRHGEPKLDPSIINAHTGEVRDGWLVTLAIEDGAQLEISNDSYIYNAYLKEGTSKMFARGEIEDRVREEMEVVSQEIIEAELIKEFE